MYAYSDRLTKLNSFWLLSSEIAYEALRQGLSDIFDLLYTKDMTTRIVFNCSFFCCALLTRTFTILLPVAAIGLFHGSHKKVYRGSDVTVTYILLYITFLLEAFSLMSLPLYHWRWPDTVPQHNIIGFFVHNKRRTWFMSIVGCLQLRLF